MPSTAIRDTMKPVDSSRRRRTGSASPRCPRRGERWSGACPDGPGRGELVLPAPATSVDIRQDYLLISAVTAFAAASAAVLASPPLTTATWALAIGPQIAPIAGMAGIGMPLAPAWRNFS